MSRLLRQRTVSLLGLLAACAVVPGAVMHFCGETEVQISGTVHFLPIAVSAGLAAAAAIALTVAGARRGDARSAWTLENALDLISREAGTKFDLACVDALERVIGRERDDNAAREAA